MSISKIAAAAVAATALISSHAMAMSITNRDTSDHTVVIQKGDAESEHALPAGGVLEEACEDGCLVRLAGFEGEHAAQNRDRFVIQGGAIQRQNQ